MRGSIRPATTARSYDGTWARSAPCASLVRRLSATGQFALHSFRAMVTAPIGGFFAAASAVAFGLSQDRRSAQTPSLVRHVRVRRPPATRRALKLALLYASRALGFFQLARWLTSGKLRILCYHGFALGDESSFRPRLFIEPATLERRLNYLRRSRIPVVSLHAALDQLTAGTIPKGATVITIDDGFFSTRQTLLSLFSPAKMPATVYVTSYYADNQAPIFRLAAQYMFWKTGASRLDLAEAVPGLVGVVGLDDSVAADRALVELTSFAEHRLDEEGRQRCLRRLGQLLGIDYDALAASRRLSLMTAEEIRSIAAAGFDVQLHTHRHRFPIDAAQARRELHDNRRWLAANVETKLEHFCYPSGEWSPEHFSILSSEGIRSAVTCDTGLNDGQSNQLALNRFVDGEDVAQIEFEAEMSGFLELLRKLRPSRNGAVRSQPSVPPSEKL